MISTKNQKHMVPDGCKHITVDMSTNMCYDMVVDESTKRMEVFS